MRRLRTPIEGTLRRGTRASCACPGLPVRRRVVGRPARFHLQQHRPADLLVHEAERIGDRREQQEARDRRGDVDAEQVVRDAADPAVADPGEGRVHRHQGQPALPREQSLSREVPGGAPASLKQASPPSKHHHVPCRSPLTPAGVHAPKNLSGNEKSGLGVDTDAARGVVAEGEAAGGGFAPTAVR